MDLGIAGRRAIVCGSSRGLGRACAEALAAEGVLVTLNGLDQGRTQAAADAIAAAYGVAVQAVAADVGRPEGRAALLAACPEPDILVNNTGGPPVLPLAETTEAQWVAALNDVMLSAVLLAQATAPGMAA